MNKVSILSNYILFRTKKIYYNLLNKNDKLLDCISNGDIKDFNKVVNRFNVRFQDKEKNSLLHYACIAGKVDIVKRALELGVNINHQNIRGETPLLIILLIKPPHHMKIIEVLTEHKCSIYMKDNKGEDALDYACNDRDLPTIHHIFKYDIPKDRMNYNTLLKAVKASDLSNIKLIDIIIIKGFDINLKNNENQGLLHYFANLNYFLSSKDLSMFEYILKKGGDVFCLDKKGEDVLDLVLSFNGTKSRAFIIAIAKKYTNEDIFESIFKRVSNRYNSPIDNDFLFELKEIQASSRREKYEAILSVKSEKPVKKVKI